MNGTPLVASPVIEGRSLTTHFTSERGVVHAVDDVSIRIERCSTLAVIGESGSGKSVLARSLVGLLPRHALTSGQVLLEGRALNSMSREQKRRLWGGQLGMIFQDPKTALNPVMRIGRQMTEVLSQHKQMRGATARSYAIELLSRVGVPDPARRISSFPHELSGGMQQRVCIAIAIACEPKLLIADEPTTALDVTIQEQILNLVFALQRTNDMSMLFITHDLGVVAGRADKSMVMYGGQVVEEGDTNDVLRRTRHPYTAGLVSSTPRLSQPSHSVLDTIPGRPVEVVDPAPGCRFANRCARAQSRCTSETPQLRALDQGTHRVRCFYPVGTPEGEAALTGNRAAGTTATGLDLSPLLAGRGAS